MPDIEYLVKHRPRDKKMPFLVTAIVHEDGRGSDVRFVTTSRNLVLQSINGFRSLKLKEGAFAPIRRVKSFRMPKVDSKAEDPDVIFFQVYYSGRTANFYAGKLDRSGEFQRYKPFCTVSFPDSGY